jgi:hypothetical protein
VSWTLHDVNCADEPGHLLAFLVGGADADARIEEDDVTHVPARSCQRGDVVGEMGEGLPDAVAANPQDFAGQGE